MIFRYTDINTSMKYVFWFEEFGKFRVHLNEQKCDSKRHHKLDVSVNQNRMIKTIHTRNVFIQA